MAKSSARKRIKPKPVGRKAKKKISPLLTDGVNYVDYKDVDILKRFMSDRAKIRSRRVTGNDSQQQREIARAIKNAREMGLLAYTSRVTTQRRGGGGRRDERGEGRPSDGDRRNDRGDDRGGDAPNSSENHAEEVADIEGVEVTTAEATTAEA
jgi:small subunit ribosomal protein S18